MFVISIWDLTHRLNMLLLYANIIWFKYFMKAY